MLTIDDEPAIDLIEWTSDGQLLATASASGTIHVYLSQLKILGDKYGTSLAFLSSLLEVTVFNVHEDVQDSVMIVRVEIEPSHIAIGPFHLAVAMNNRLWLYSLTAGAAAVAEAADPQNQQQQQQLNLLVGEHEYVGIVKTVKMNAHYIAVQFTNGSLQLHAIENSGTGGGDSASHQEHIYHYPDGAEMAASAKSNGGGSSKSSASVTSIALTADFLIFSVASGQVHYFILEDWAAVVVYRHHPPGVGISLLEANLNGTRLILQDDRGDVFILNVYGEQVVAMAPEHVPTTTNRSGGGGGAPLKALWESWIADRAVFTLSDGKFIYVYAAVRATVEGGKVEYVGKMKIPGGQFPLLLYNGVIVCQTKSGKTSNFILSTHDYSIKATASEAAQREVFRSILKLRRWADAMKICSYLNDAGGEVGTFWKELGEAALYDLQVDVAIRVYSHLKQYGLVHSLQQYKREEEQSLFAGYLAELLGRFDLAQRHFLASSKPLCALQMRKNLLHWDEALALARHLAPGETPAICRQLAQHQEYGAQYRAALENFESALQNFSESSSSSTSSSKHILLCQGGIARNAIRCGDVKRGLQVLSTTSLDPVRDVDVFTECASILQQLKHHQEAAGLYERVGQFNTAASLYLKAKNTAKLNALLPNIDDPEILTELARSKEADRAFRPALDIYAKAGQWLDVVRLHLDHLNSPGEAVKVVRERRSVEGAKLIAKYFQRRGDTTTAIEFLVLSKCTDDAYNLAKTTNAMDTYADILEDLGDRNAPASAADFRTIAIYYEQQQQDGGSSKGQHLLKAGKFYVLAKLYKKGVKLLLQAAAAASASPEEEADALELAIEAAAAARDEQITRLVLDFLMGESDIGNGGNGGNGSNGGGGVGDGLPKDFKYLFKLYMKMEYYKEAAKTAVIISREEQAQGNYRNAHQLLFGMCSELRRHGIAIPAEMTDGLLLVHSYMLAKVRN